MFTNPKVQTMSSSHSRILKGYLPPKNHSLSVAYMKLKGIGKSELVNTMAANFFNQLPASERQQLTQIVKKNQANNGY